MDTDKTPLPLPQPAARIAREPESVWVEFVQLALDNKPLNLGQGFPDFPAPAHLVDALRNATDAHTEPAGAVLANQYTRPFGHPRLVRALARYYRDFRHFDKLTDPDAQVLVTVGAYEALFTAIMAFVGPGDEAIIIEPAFDAYEPMVRMAGGRAVPVALRPDAAAMAAGNGTGRLSSAQWRLDMGELRARMGPKTKLLVLNTPNNPLGKVFERAELAAIGRLCVEHNVLVVADEVYEQMFYAPGAEHVSIAQALPDMWQRTVTIGSAGKTFSATGWKVGWALGPAHLLRYLQLVHQTAVYTVATPLQEAVARALEHEMDLPAAAVAAGAGYWASLRRDLARKRDRMAAILERARMRPVVPDGGYFMLADFGPLAALWPEYREGGAPALAGRPDSDDYRFARWLSRAKRLQGIPASAFYSDANKALGASMIRFCFIKQDATLDALERLLAALGGAAPKL